MVHGFTPHKTGNPVLDNPFWVSAVFTVVVLFGFVFLVVNSGSGHHAPAGAASGAPHGAASAPAAH